MTQILLQIYSFETTLTGLVFFLVFWLLFSFRKSKFSHGSLFSTLQEKYQSYLYLFRGVTMIDAAYKQSNGMPFVINTPSKANIMVTSQMHIQELDRAPRYQLSLHAVAKEFLQPKYTMHGFEWKDQRGVEGTGFVRTLRSLLTSQLPRLMTSLSEVVKEQIATELSKSKIHKGGLFEASWHRVSIFAAAKQIVTRTNSAVFFPKELSTNPEFIKAALEFPEDVFLGAEIIRIFPKSIAPFLSRLFTRNHRSTTVMYKYLFPIVESRMAKANKKPEDTNEEEEANDGIQWLIDTTPKREFWSTERLVGEIMAVWYGSLHTLAIATTYALLDLYSRPEYVSSLRAEAEGPLFEEFSTSSLGLPEMDSFLKESARLSAFESTGVRRHALEDFQFSDGLRIPKNTWVCVPHRAMMQDDAYFHNALHFDGRRFLSDTHGAHAASKLSDRSDSWLVWGAGRITCPGRFYAAVILKLVLSNMLKEYDCELEKITGDRFSQWRTSLIPKASLTLRIRRREILGKAVSI